MRHLDRQKLARFNLDYDQKRASLRAVMDLIDASCKRAEQLRFDFESGADQACLDAIWDHRIVADLLRMPAEELAAARVDVPALRAAAAEVERTAELRRRSDVLAAELAPLTVLHKRLNDYAQGN